MTFLGMDVAQTREHCRSLRTAQQRTEDLIDVLSSSISASAQHWVGHDADEFRARWVATAETPGRRLAAALAQVATDLEQHVREQDIASEPGDDADASGEVTSASTPDLGRGRNEGPGGTEDVSVSPEVAAAWDDMEPEDQKAVLQEIANQELKRYGHPELTLYFDDMEYLGQWRGFGLFRGEHIRIDETHVDDPDSLHTVVHEVRHAAQDQWVRDTNLYELGLWPEKGEAKFAEIEEEHGVTREDIRAFRKNALTYDSGPEWPGDNATPEEYEQYHRDYEEYASQPLEADAFAEGDRFEGGITLEQLQQYQRDAGVPVTGQ